MSTHEQASKPTFAVRNIEGKGKEQVPSKLKELASDAELRQYCDKHYHQLLPLIAERVHQEKKQQDKLKEVKACLNFEGCSRRNLQTQVVTRGKVCLHTQMNPNTDSTMEAEGRRRVTTRAPTREEQSLPPENIIRKHPQKSKTENDSFTPRIHHFDLPKRTRMPSHVKTYDGSEDPEDHLKTFQAAAKVERWAMPTWCHMFNSTLTGSTRKKCIKDPIEIYHIKQREGESTKDFMQRFKLESKDVKGTPECMRISGFMHRITNPDLIKRLHDKILKSVDEIIKVTTSFLRGEVAAGHNTDEYMHLKRQIEELLKVGKLSHLINELKQNNGRDQTKPGKKGEASNKDKPLAILMEEGDEGPMIIEVEIEGHFIHRIYVDGGLASEILYEHCFNKLLPEIKNQMVLATIPPIGFNGEIIWPLGQISLLVNIGDEEHSTSAWMNFVIVRSSSPYNRIIGRPGIKKIQTVPSTTY
ncbi:hypothetical protein Tco_0145195 [Tanacetum coccineum]